MRRIWNQFKERLTTDPIYEIREQERSIAALEVRLERIESLLLKIRVDQISSTMPIPMAFDLQDWPEDSTNEEANNYDNTRF